MVRRRPVLTDALHRMPTLARRRGRAPPLITSQSSANGSSKIFQALTSDREKGGDQAGYEVRPTNRRIME